MANKQKLIYVASPVRAISERVLYVDDAQREIIETAKKAARAVKNAGHIPISPVLIWFDVYDDYREREQLMTNCKLLLELCDEIYVAKSPYSKFSDGIKQERIWSQELGMLEVEYA